MKLTVEVEGEGMLPSLPGDGAALVALMSFAVVRGFGATHPLIALADRLHEVHRVRLGPLTTFYEAMPDDAEDREKLELSWQRAAELKESLEAVVRAMAEDSMLATFERRGGTEGIADQAQALAHALEPAATGGARVRLGYVQ